MKLNQILEMRVFIGPVIALAISVGCSETPQQAAPPAASNPQPAAAAPAANVADLTTSDVTVDVGAVRMMVSVPQRPIVTAAPRRFCVRTEVDGIQVDLAKGTLTFDTDPPSGAQRYTLAETPDGCHSADVTLTAPANGATRWYGTVEGSVDEQSLSARFQFNAPK